MRNYGVIYTAFWTSSDMQGLSDQAKLLASYLLSGPHTTAIGCFRVPDGYILEDLGWPLETVRKGFDELFGNGFATRDEPSKWVLIHKFLKWNKIENPNQGKFAAGLFDQVPAIPLKSQLAQAIRDFCPHFPREVLNRFETLPEPLGQPYRNQEPNPNPNPNPNANPEPEPQPRSLSAGETEARLGATRASGRTDEVAIDLEFDDGFWPVYPKRVDKGAARKAYRAARKKTSVDVIGAGVLRYAAERAGQDPTYTKGPAKWLNDEAWANESASKANGAHVPHTLNPAMSVFARAMQEDDNAEF
jgi:hypothetical protein